MDFRDDNGELDLSFTRLVADTEQELDTTPLHHAAAVYEESPPPRLVAKAATRKIAHQGTCSAVRASKAAAGALQEQQQQQERLQQQQWLQHQHQQLQQGQHSTHDSFNKYLSAFLMLVQASIAHQHQRRVHTDNVTEAFSLLTSTPLHSLIVECLPCLCNLFHASMLRLACTHPLQAT